MNVWVFVRDTEEMLTLDSSLGHYTCARQNELQRGNEHQTRGAAVFLHPSRTVFCLQQRPKVENWGAQEQNENIESSFYMLFNLQTSVQGFTELDVFFFFSFFKYLLDLSLEFVKSPFQAMISIRKCDTVWFQSLTDMTGCWVRNHVILLGFEPKLHLKSTYSAGRDVNNSSLSTISVTFIIF